MKKGGEREVRKGEDVSETVKGRRDRSCCSKAERERLYEIVGETHTYHISTEEDGERERGR